MQELQEPLWIELEETTSTNAVLRERAQAGASQHGVCIAQRQTEGKGRLGRRWLSPEGGLYLSWLVPVGGVSPLWFQPLAGLAVLDALPGLPLSLKWPNDILASTEDGERKLGGILSELLPQTPQGPHIIVGVGLNLQTEISLPEADLQAHALPPVALKQLTSELLDPLALGRAVVHAMRTRLQSLRMPPQKQAEAALRDAWLQACGTLGREVRVLQPDGRWLEGQAIDVDDQLSLLVRDEKGTIHTVAAGDCRHLRIA